MIRTITKLSAYPDDERLFAEPAQSLKTFLDDNYAAGEVVIFATAAYFLMRDCSIEGLSLMAARRGAAVCEDASGQLFLIGVRTDRHPEHLCELLRRLSSTVNARQAGRMGKTLFAPHPGELPIGGMSASAEEPEFRIASQQFASPPFINTALTEVLYHITDDAEILDSVDYLRRALVRCRERSAVPWIFNELLNEVEYTIGLCRPESIPPEVHLSVSGLCNIECKFCSYTHASARKHFVDVIQFAKLNFLRNARILRLHSGNGEPTSNPHLADIIKYVGCVFPHVSLNFFTNGILLDRPNLVPALILGNVEWISVSINAATSESWKALCGADQFERVCSNVESVRDEKRRCNTSRPRLYGSMVLTRDSAWELPSMPALCRKIGIERFTAIPFFSLGYESENRLGSADAYHHIGDTYDEIYQRTVEKAEQYRISIELPLPRAQTAADFGVERRAYHDFAGLMHGDMDLSKLLADFAFERPTDSFCQFLWRQAAIGSVNRHQAGEDDTHFLYPCLGPLAALEATDATLFHFPDEDGFQDLWKNPIFTTLRDGQLHRGLVPVCDACRGCDSRDPSAIPAFSELVRAFKEKLQIT
jgi:MoaA/NifB/PqqE/SkfB family radical SAM enzyme